MSDDIKIACEFIRLSTGIRVPPDALDVSLLELYDPPCSIWRRLLIQYRISCPCYNMCFVLENAQYPRRRAAWWKASAVDVAKCLEEWRCSANLAQWEGTEWEQIWETLISITSRRPRRPYSEGRKRTGGLMIWLGDGEPNDTLWNVVHQLAWACRPVLTKPELCTLFGANTPAEQNHLIAWLWLTTRCIRETRGILPGVLRPEDVLPYRDDFDDFCGYVNREWKAATYILEALDEIPLPDPNAVDPRARDWSLHYVYTRTMAEQPAVMANLVPPAGSKWL